MMTSQIDRTPPRLTGDDRKDMQNIIEYLSYLQDKINMLIKVLNMGREV